MTLKAGAVLAAALLAAPAAAQYVQEGAKLVGSGASGPAEQGRSVAISADGATAALGGWQDGSGQGAAWVFTRAGGAWSQQGGKLAGSGAAGAASQGSAVALSSDGDTLVVGGFTDDGGVGAAWVFTRDAEGWAQQGEKLVPSDAAGPAQLGISAAVSADGNTAILGGWGDDSGFGAAWVFTREAGAWAQQGGKLVAADAAGAAAQGCSVAVSADGNTAAVGGWGDRSGAGAVWVYTRADGAWSQQGGRLVGGGAIGRASQGTAVALSADGDTLVVGGWGDNAGLGAAWLFTRSGGVWAQRGGKMSGIGAADPDGHVQFGSAVAVSADGGTAVVGGLHDTMYAGAAWFFTLRDGSWAPEGGKVVGSGALGFARQGASAAVSGNGSTVQVGGYGDGTTAGAAWAFTRAGCSPPWVTAPPRDDSVPAGQAATLVVTAIGTPPLSYRWYRGEAGDATVPVGEDGPSLVTDPLTSPASYWVRVGNACGSAASASATVSIAHEARRRVRRPA